jgi:hypothetical protein
MDFRPANGPSAAALLRILVTTIDGRSFERGDVLLETLLAFAWPCRDAQNQ